MLHFKTNELYGNKMSKASLYYQTLLYFDGIYTNVLFPFQFFLFIYKYNSLVYTSLTIGLQIFLLIVAFIINLIRLSLGSSGNKGKLIGKIIGYLILTCVLVVGYVYMIVWQNYIYNLELIMYIIAMIIAGMEFIMGIIALIVHKVTK